MRWSLGKAKVMFRGKFIAWNIFLNIEDENNELKMWLRIEGEATPTNLQKQKKRLINIKELDKDTIKRWIKISKELESRERVDLINKFQIWFF